MIDWNALERADAPLNAFIDLDRQAAGGDGPLAGVTIGIKANIAVAGLPWTAGMALYRDRIAARDADAVARLRAAGAALLGTLNMEEAALGAKTDNPWFGATQNPHRLGHTPGGSSGGSGSAVAAGLCDAALGSDTMGSVRIPAAYCGIYGFKPANDRVSQDGLEIAEASLDCIGPLARSLDMLERVARTISDFGEGDSTRVSTLAELGGGTCEEAVREAHDHARRHLGADRAIALAHPLWRIRFAGFIKTSKALAARIGGEPGLSPALARLLDYGPRRSAEDWADDQAVLADTAARLRDAVAGGGMLLMPTAPQAAFPHAEAAPSNQADFTCLANIAGLPAISLPAGWNADGLPVAVQLVGALGHEAGLFAAARALDAALSAFRPPAHFLEGEARCESSACSS